MAPHSPEIYNTNVLNMFLKDVPIFHPHWLLQPQTLPTCHDNKHHPDSTVVAKLTKEFFPLVFWNVLPFSVHTDNFYSTIISQRN